MKEALHYGLIAFAIISGAGIGFFVIIGCAHIFNALDDLIEAARRYRCRHYIITEYYEHDTLSHIERIKDPQPWQVKLAKAGKRSSKMNDKI